MKAKKSWLILLSFSLLVLFIVGCQETESKSSGDIKEIKIGFTPGPYSDQVKEAIQPHLEKKGYKVSIVEFSNGTEPNLALANGSIDANVFQHTAYFEDFKKEHNLDLYELIKVATAPMGLYSDKHKSLEELQDGATIAIPNDPVNFARGLRILEKVGWVELKPNYDPIGVSEKDILKKKKNFSFVELEQPQLPRSLADTDFSLVNGNYIISSGRKLQDALYLETPPPEFQNLVAVRTEDKDKPFVKAIEEAYRSKEYKQLIETDERYKDYYRPDYLK
jgi:D-methionine transport system substrate-binding protein